MFKYYYFSTVKYIYIYIYITFEHKSNYLLYQGFFFKHDLNWFIFCNFFKEFLFEVGLLKCQTA